MPPVDTPVKIMNIRYVVVCRLVYLNTTYAQAQIVLPSSLTTKNREGTDMIRLVVAAILLAIYSTPLHAEAIKVVDYD